jgi:hypothetical protein
VNAQKYVRPKGQICAVLKSVLNKVVTKNVYFSFADDLGEWKEFEFERRGVGC